MRGNQLLRRIDVDGGRLCAQHLRQLSGRKRGHFEGVLLHDVLSHRKKIRLR